MQFRLIRMRFRRRLIRGQHQVEDLGTQAERGLEKHFYRRFSRLLAVRRFVIGWVLLVILLIAGVTTQAVLLSGYYQTLRPVRGGIYNEGELGTFSNANPLYASSDVDSSVSHLLFSGLFTYNGQNQLVGDLASSYSVDDRHTTYTVHLRPDVTWQDGKQLTASDVAFTYQLIQNPDAQSPLLGSWQGIKVNATDKLTVTFKLPTPLASFPYTMTNGIVPQHLLSNIAPTNLRSADFNTVHPVGSGPFSWQGIAVENKSASETEQQIELLPFAGYHGGKPKLDEFVVHAYSDQGQLSSDLKHGELNGAEGLSSLPASLTGDKAIQSHNLLLTAANMVFFKTSTGVLADQKVRAALVQGANIQAVINHLGYTTHAVREPLLQDQLGYDSSKQQASYDSKAAQATLDADGWVMGSDGVRSKAGQQLTFGLSASDVPEDQAVTHELASQWKALGAAVHIQLQTPADFQNVLTDHDYDAVLYGISIGVDPDVFVYWDSSQADIRSGNRLNLSEYKNTTADLALEAGRTRLDPQLRAIKYNPFLAAWQQDAPALGLYQPRVLYLTNGTVNGLDDHTVNTATDRFDNVQNWEIRESKVTD